MSIKPTLKFPAPAKVNLCLRIFGKRRDGYHGLHTLFERISLKDEVFLSPLPSGIELRCDSREVPQGPGNIAYQAAKLLKDRHGVPGGVKIRIKKRIPVAAGLGGGSSDAASVLLGLNRLWNLGLSRKELLALGKRLGSDVPFFLLETSFAVGRGRGERLKKLKAPFKRIWHCLVHPGFRISTSRAYARLKPSFLTPQNTDARMLVRSIQKSDASGLSKLLTNDLELTLNNRLRTISKIKKELCRLGAMGSLMSGSGATVFGIFSSQKQARKAARLLKKMHRNWRVFVSSTEDCPVV